MEPWKDPDLRNYRRALRVDPCSYCGGPGGTVDHIDPRPAGGGRWNWGNMTGACERCNRRKDRGKDGGHHSILHVLRARTDEARTERLRALLGRLVPGGEVYVPWGERGTVLRVGKRAVLVWIPSEEREWRCANPFALRDSRGGRLG